MTTFLLPLAGLIVFALVAGWAHYEAERYRHMPTPRARRQYRTRRGL